MIEDDASLRRLVAEYFGQEGVVLMATSRVDVYAVGAAAQAQVIILGDSSETGVEQFVKRLRGERSVPVVLLVSKDTDEPLDGVEFVDAVVTKPFDIAELYSLVEGLLPADDIVAEPFVSAAGIEIDMQTFRASVDGEEVDLSTKEIQLLYLLVSHPGRVFSREELASRVWGRLLSDNHVIAVHINHIRDRIGGYKKNLCTLRGLGYMFRL